MTLLRSLTGILLTMAVLRVIWWAMTSGRDGWLEVPHEIRDFVRDVPLIAIVASLILLGCLWLNDWIWMAFL